MVLSPRVIETLIDLVEIKLSLIEVHDREDSRELAWLEQCRSELRGLTAGGATPGDTRAAAKAGAVAAFAKASKPRRPRAAA